MATAHLTVLGSGASGGVPVVACDCGVCRSGAPQNKRARTSCLIECGGKTWCVDTGPDFRFQALRAGVKKLDAVFYTHPHSDHVNGFDDLRAFCAPTRRAVPIYSDEFCIDMLRDKFGYGFLPVKNDNWNRPAVEPHVIEEGDFEALGMTFRMFRLPHGPWRSCCYRFGSLAWLTDVGEVDDATVENNLQGLDWLFIDCLMPRKCCSHLNHEAAFDAAARIGAKRTALVHVSHRFGHEELSALCPPGVEPAYDGMEADFEI